MNKREFIEKLALALAGQVPRSVIEENIAYYDRYISEEVRHGKPERQVLDELGDPRLIARSIIEANGGGDEMAGVYEDSDSGEETQYEREEERDPFFGEKRRNFHVFHFQGFWLSLIVIALFLIFFWLVAAIIGGIFMLLRPLLFPLLLIGAAWWLWRSRR